MQQPDFPTIPFIRKAFVSASLGFMLFGCQGGSPQTSLASANREPALAATAAPATAIPTSAPASSQPPIVLAAPAPAPPAAVFSPERAYQDVEGLAVGIGSRVAGTRGQDQAADYIASQLEAASLTSERQPFQFSAYVDRGSSLEVLSPSRLSPNARALMYSPAGDVSGELVHIDLGRVGDFDPGSVRGKVALARRGEIFFSQKVANLAASGASAIIIFNNAPGAFAGNLTGMGEIPAIAISLEEGEQLLASIQSGVTRVRVRVDADAQQQPGVNVIGTKPGGARTVVVGAHFDSVSAGPGANDNASGTATMLELARAVATRQYPFTVRFVAFGAEEIGLLGSRHYVSQLGETAADSTLAMLNLDMVGVGDRLSLGGDGVLVDRALIWSEQAGVPAGRMGGGMGSASDHSSFQAVGVPTLFVYRVEDPRYHTAEDRAEYVDPENLRVAGQLILSTLDDLAAEHP